jgi:hypothetical protein
MQILNLGPRQRAGNPSINTTKLYCRVRYVVRPMTGDNKLALSPSLVDLQKALIRES